MVSILKGEKVPLIFHSSSNKQTVNSERKKFYLFSLISATHNININYEPCIWYDNDARSSAIFLKYFIIALFLEMVFILVNVK